MDSTLITPDLLGFFPLLRPLPKTTLEHLAKVASMRDIPRRGIAYEARTNSTAVYFLFEGRLQGTDFTIDGREVGLFFTEPGDYCGELGLFDYGVHPETTIATVKSRVICLPTGELRAAIFSQPDSIASACSRIASRVRTLTAQRAMLAIPDIPQRVCAQLLDLGRDPKTQDIVEIMKAPTHQEIAIMLNTSRETVTRIFQRLQSAEVLIKDTNQHIKILQPDVLAELARGDRRL